MNHDDAELRVGLLARQLQEILNQGPHQLTDEERRLLNDLTETLLILLEVDDS